MEFLKYNRILTPGSGSSLYGLEVCKAMDMVMIFLIFLVIIFGIMCLNNKMIANMQNQTQMKQSHYNSNKIVNFCEICHKNKIEVQIETHHIHYQKDADNTNHIGHLKKNEQYNLVGLCKQCHLQETNGIIDIKGYEFTSEGRKLNYVINETQTKKVNKKIIT